MELNYWTATELEGGSYDDQAKRWSVVLRHADGSKREMRPRHIVLATGASGIPNIPDIPTLRNFSGPILHSSQYKDAEAWKQKNVLVVGSGNSGHDIAQDLYSNGAKVTLVQRSSTLIVSVEPSAQLPYALYDEGPSLEDCDLISSRLPSHFRLQNEVISCSRSRLKSWTRICSMGSSAKVSGWISEKMALAGSSNILLAVAVIISMSAAPI